MAIEHSDALHLLTIPEVNAAIAHSKCQVRTLLDPSNRANVIVVFRLIKLLNVSICSVPQIQVVVKGNSQYIGLRPIDQIEIYKNK